MARPATPRSSGLAAPAPDYAPSGMPDFSQCRSAWSRAGSPGQWTHAGPVAVADALWWLDSVAEPNPRTPPEVSDGFPLVAPYPRFGPAIDDHDVENLEPLVTDLALRADTEGATLRDDVHGTRWEDLIAATQAYVHDRRLEDELTVTGRMGFEASWVADALGRGGAAVTLLGVWETNGAGWWRVGGHYAAVAGMDANTLLLADPLADRGDRAGGVERPPDPARHSCREAPADHDDAAVVSYDPYPLAAARLPAGGLVLEGYFEPLTYGEAAAFEGQNPAAFLGSFAGPWTKGPVAMAIDGVLTLVPVALPATPTASPSPTPTETAPPPTATPEASATPPPSSTPTAAGTPLAPPAVRYQVYLPLVSASRGRRGAR